MEVGIVFYLFFEFSLIFELWLVKLLELRYIDFVDFVIMGLGLDFF